MTLQEELERLRDDVETALSQAERLWLLREIEATEERISYQPIGEKE